MPFGGKSDAVRVQRDADIILIHGTFDRPVPGEGPKWHERGSQFEKRLVKRLNEFGVNVRCHRLVWNGGNSWIDRFEASNELAQLIHNLHSNAELHIIAHSHGGNIAVDGIFKWFEMNGVMSKNLTHYELGCLVFMGTPFLIGVHDWDKDLATGSKSETINVFALLFRSLLVLPVLLLRFVAWFVPPVLGVGLFLLAWKAIEQAWKILPSASSMIAISVAVAVVTLVALVAAIRNIFEGSMKINLGMLPRATERLLVLTSQDDEARWLLRDLLPALPLIAKVSTERQESASEAAAKLYKQKVAAETLSGLRVKKSYNSFYNYGEGLFFAVGGLLASQITISGSYATLLLGVVAPLLFSLACLTVLLGLLKSGSIGEGSLVDLLFSRFGSMYDWLGYGYTRLKVRLADRGMRAAEKMIPPLIKRKVLGLEHWLGIVDNVQIGIEPPQHVCGPEYYRLEEISAAVSSERLKYRDTVLSNLLRDFVDHFKIGGATEESIKNLMNKIARDQGLVHGVYYASEEVVDIIADWLARDVDAMDKAKIEKAFDEFEEQEEETASSS